MEQPRDLTEASRQPIEGVNVRYIETYADERGELCETWLPSWALHPDPIGMVVFVTIRPGQIRGWVVHDQQDDRVFIAVGSAKIVLYDGRAQSPTHGCINVLLLGSERRATFTIPAGVYHAFQNIGQDDVAFIDMPNRLFNPENPDTSRLPLENNTIPYRWR
jgi:dTDP-4-dehydrorhamnose 3,5-epimerase